MTRIMICNALPILTREEQHRFYGGQIYATDYNTDYRGRDNNNGSTIARRIERENKHFEKLRKDGKYNYGW